MKTSDEFVTSINGLWVELPLLVEQLPESWSLASYLSIIVQFANLGPLTIGLLRWICHEKIPIAWIIVGKNSFILRHSVIEKL